jgi:alkylated DNA repair dioxygenase AlkB
MYYLLGLGIYLLFVYRLIRSKLRLPGAEVNYYPDFVKPSLRIKLIQELSALNWTKDRVTTSTSNYKLNRGTNVFGDAALLERSPPKIWGDTRQIQVWTPSMLKLKHEIETTTGCAYNVCLVNYYMNGKDHIHWHSDKEELGDQNSIASISLGASRHFLFRVKSTLSSRLLWWIRWISGRCWRRRDIILDLELTSGSLLFMGKKCQELYEHTLPKDERVTVERFNLTFRRFHY